MARVPLTSVLGGWAMVEVLGDTEREQVVWGNCMSIKVSGRKSCFSYLSHSVGLSQLNLRSEGCELQETRENHSLHPRASP